VSYQFTLAFAFLVGGPIGKSITQAMVRRFQYRPSYAEAINSSQNYPYYYLYRNMVLAALKR
jgi:hypothetical protein